MFAKLNKKALIFLSAGGAIALLLTLFVYLHVAIPGIVEKKILSGFQATHFGYARAESLERKSSKIILSHVSLDEDDFNTIKSIEARYRFFPLIFLGQIDKLIIIEPSLTYSVASGTLLQTPQDLIANIDFSDAPLYKINLVEIIDGTLDILSSDWGGFHFDFDVFVRPTDKTTRSIEANFKSSQKQFSTHFQVSGEINKETGWGFEATMERSRLELDDIQISRATGRLSISGSNNGFFANGEFNIGGFKIGELAWSDIAATFEQSSRNFQWIIAGNALGNKDIEFGLNYSQKDPLNIYGTLYTKKLSDLLHYLNNEQTQPIENSQVAKIEDVFLTYSLPIATIFNEKKNVIFSLKKPEQNIDIKGNIFISKNYISVRALMSPTFVENINLIYDGAVLKKAYMNASLAYTSSDPKDNAFLINIKEGILALGALPIQKIETSVAFSPPEALQMQDYADAAFTLLLDKSIEQSGIAKFKLGEKLEIKDIVYNIFNGQLKLKPVAIGALPIALSIQAIDIDAGAAAKAIGSDIEASGKIGIKGTVHVEKDSLIAQKLVLSSSSTGILRIPETYSKSLFNDGTIDHEMATQALQNFRYEFFEITVNGNLKSTANLKISMKGKNPDLLNNRPIVIDMTLRNQNLAQFWQYFSPSANH